MSTTPDVKYTEALCCNVHFYDRIAKVAVFYRTTNAESVHLEPFFDYRQSHVHGGSIVLASDFNLLEIDWCSIAPEVKAQSILLDIELGFNLEQLDPPTRVQGTSS